MAVRKRFIISSDWHGDAVTEGVVRLPDIAYGVEKSIAAAVYTKADGYIMCGDLTDPHTSRAHAAIGYAVQCATSLKKSGIPSFWVTGNHDVIENGEGHHTMMALKYVPGATVFDTPRGINIGDDTFLVALPYVEAARTYDMEQFVKLAADMCRGARAVVVLGHLDAKGATYGSETDTMPRGRTMTWPLDLLDEYLPKAVLIGGHLHKPQTIGRLHIVGSIARFNHGEESHRPGYLGLEV